MTARAITRTWMQVYADHAARRLADDIDAGVVDVVGRPHVVFYCGCRALSGDVCLHHGDPVQHYAHGRPGCSNGSTG